MARAQTVDPAEPTHFYPSRPHLLVGLTVLAAALVALFVLAPAAAQRPLAYIAAEALAAALAAACTFLCPRLALGVQAAVGLGVYAASLAGGVPIWTYRFGAEREALQLFFKYALVFGSGTLVLAAYKMALSDARRQAWATRMALFIALVLAANVLWTVTYECAREPLHCALVRAEAVVLAVWLGARTLSSACTDTPMVQTSAWRVDERRATAPALVYVSGVISREWVLAYTAWNVGFVLEHFSDAVVIQDATFWATMLYFRARDEQPRALHAYFYEARAVSLGAHMTVSAVFGIAAGPAARGAWVSSDGGYERYAPEGTLALMIFAAAVNIGASVAFALPACASAWRATMLARERLGSVATAAKVMPSAGAARRFSASGRWRRASSGSPSASPAPSASEPPAAADWLAAAPTQPVRAARARAASGDAPPPPLGTAHAASAVSNATDEP
ncbi:hypothetical protein KFE25_011277 [Diacronema lutheri]|uniref:Uncharacterized protein n=1 Tax=Diacronema lutheri TaxID=2081491 RepID=A0A8J5X736_DIALT|nr:hypothetical protein KFE25_011277 [Diacronema lutheri]